MAELRVEREGLSDAAVADLGRRVELLNRRARKLGVAELRVELGAERLVPLKAAPGVPERFKLVRDAAVIGDSPRLAGWALVAVLDHDGPETVTHRVPAEPGSPLVNLEGYRDARAHCDHCGTTRRRLDTFVVAHERGTLSQVGRNCLTDFLGGLSPAALLWLAGWTRELAGGDSDGTGGGVAEVVVNPLDFLTAAATCRRVDGWVSRGRARELGLGHSTAGDAWDLVDPPRDTSEAAKKWAREHQATDDDRALAAAALAWARDLDPADADEYRSNLGRMARKDHTRRRDAGLLASAVAGYARTIERERERRLALVSRHLGIVGERRRGVVVKVLGRSVHESDWGAVTLVRMVTSEGERLKWWTNTGGVELVDGLSHPVDLTVKEHGEWQGVPETLVTRVVVQALDRAATKLATKATRALDRAAAALIASGQRLAVPGARTYETMQDTNEAAAVLAAAARRVADACVEAQAAALDAFQQQEVR